MREKKEKTLQGSHTSTLQFSNSKEGSFGQEVKEKQRFFENKDMRVLEMKRDRERR